MIVATILGARPQFVKAAPLSAAISEAGHEELMIHTGQHYDYAMSQVFFDELRIREPDINLEVGSAPHGRQTGEIMIRLEKAMEKRRPNRVVVYGDTNSTLAGAITAAKMRIPVAHIEAGLRSFNREMPEEHNRVLADHCSDLLFCPTPVAVQNLRNEGIASGVHLVGDPMCDAVRIYGELAGRHSDVLGRMGLESRGYVVVTLHRPYNVDVPENLSSILSAFAQMTETVIFPVHPRTRTRIDALGPGIKEELDRSDVRMVDPLGYLDMLQLQRNARLILTDSGGVQKEAYIHGVPCITLRPETEWIETVQTGWNALAGADTEAILRMVNEPIPSDRPHPLLFGDGYSAQRIVERLN